jgi:hypothetical protein
VAAGAATLPGQAGAEEGDGGSAGSSEQQQEEGAGEGGRPASPGKAQQRSSSPEGSQGPESCAARAPQQQQQQQQQEGSEEPGAEPEDEFGFTLAERMHTLRTFRAYTDWARRMHFSALPCNAEIKAVGSKGRASSPQPPAKKPKPDPEQQAAPAAAQPPAAAAPKAAPKPPPVEVEPERHSARLQKKQAEARKAARKAAASAAGRAGAAVAKAKAAAKARAAAAAAGGGASAANAAGAAAAAVAAAAAAAAGGGASKGPLGSRDQELDPSVQQVEAEFWRVVERPDPGRVVETLYGQDLDSGRHGSGFPLPAWRGLPTDARTGRHLRLDPAAQRYSSHPWNINNMPRNRGSVLRYLRVTEPVTGVMVPWLYVGSCLSAFCWHVEDHALYSVNYLHTGGGLGQRSMCGDVIARRAMCASAMFCSQRGMQCCPRPFFLHPPRTYRLQVACLMPVSPHCPPTFVSCLSPCPPAPPPPHTHTLLPAHTLRRRGQGVVQRAGLRL